MKIYTKTGDDGTTGLFSGQRVTKNSSYVEAYGSVDELNSVMGWVAVSCEDETLKEEIIQIQHDLFVLGSDLATPLDKKLPIKRLEQDRIERLESFIDKKDQKLSPLKEFILPGGGELAARLHFARTVSRRVERRVLAHSQQNEINELSLVYLNRLSDLLFVMARWANHLASVADVSWDQSR